MHFLRLIVNGDRMSTSVRHAIIRFDQLFLLTVASVTLLVCAGCEQVFAAEFKKANCWFEIPRDRTMMCGTLTVPENRKKKTGNEVVLSVVVFEPDRERHEPIVFLTGGPGQPAEIGSNEEIVSWWEFIGAQSWMVGRRVVVVDQRGIGKSSPNLDCSQYLESNHWTEILSNVGADNKFGEVQRKELVACRTALIAKGIDLGAYNTEENAEDINDLRNALRIDKWVLYGVSYGTRLALEVMNEHPEGVSASILDSVVPLDINYLNGDGPNLERSLKILERDCRKANVCVRGISKVVETIARQLDRQPLFLRSVETEPRYTYVSGADFLDLIFGMLYDRDAISTLPELIRRTYEQDYRLLTEISFEPDDLEISEGMDYSVTCSDGHALDVINQRDQYWAKWVESDEYAWACPLWTLESRPESQKRPRRTDIPTLLLSGEYDPATPTEWANHAAETLPFGQVIVFRGVGHDVIDSDPCGSKVTADFLANPRRKLKTECIEQMEAPKFTSSIEGMWSGLEAQRATAGTNTRHGRSRGGTRVIALQSEH